MVDKENGGCSSNLSSNSALFAAFLSHHRRLVGEGFVRHPHCELLESKTKIIAALARRLLEGSARSRWAC
eukprot:scaffold20190_cov72-Skeletonema_dohrnii-CCMP3373.AAC.2